MDETTRHEGGPAGQPTPERIFQTLTAYQQSAALKTAIELDLFTAVAEGHDTAAALASARGASERGVRILCDDLAAVGFLSKEGGRYSLTPETSVFLDRRSPAYLGAMAEFLVGPQLLDAFAGLTESVRRGTTTMGERGSMSPDHPMWEDFARGMAAVMRPAAAQIAEVTGAAGMENCKVLDIAAGHGVFGVTLAARNPRAEVHAVDWGNVLAFARRNAEAEGVADRFHEIPGDAFEVEFGEGYDLALVTNFFHHFDRATCVRLMKKIRPALAPGGRVVTLEFVPDEGRTTPPHAAVFPLVMLASTEAGDAYTFSEYEAMFSEAGYSRSELHPGVPNAIIVTHA